MACTSETASAMANGLRGLLRVAELRATRQPIGEQYEATAIAHAMLALEKFEIEQEAGRNG